MGNYLRAYFLNSIFLFAAILFIVYGFINLDFLKGNNIDEYTNILNHALIQFIN